MGSEGKKPGVYQFGHLGYSVTHFKLVHRSGHLNLAPGRPRYFGGFDVNDIVVTSSNVTNPVIPGITIFFMFFIVFDNYILFFLIEILKSTS